MEMFELIPNYLMAHFFFLLLDVKVELNVSWYEAETAELLFFFFAVHYREYSFLCLCGGVALTFRSRTDEARKSECVSQKLFKGQVFVKEISPIML